MGEQGICARCHKGHYVDGKCNYCGFEKLKGNAVNALPNGHRLNRGRYRITRCIGSGGYGITYEAFDIKQCCAVAIKEFFPVFLMKRSQDKIDTVCLDGKRAQELEHTKFRFVDEMRLLMSLRGVKEIVTVHHSFEENHTFYYVMELLDGTDMQKHMQSRGCFTWQTLSPILVQILRALHVLHQAGFIHRDVTPDNIFLLSNQGARLIDFGNARRYDTNQDKTVVLKEVFAPKEQYSASGNQGPWTDIYSLCVTICYALTGRLPGAAGQGTTESNPLQMMNQVPQNVRRAVQIGMSTDINRRYQSIADLARDLYPGQPVLQGAQLPLNQWKPVNPPGGMQTGQNARKPVTTGKMNRNPAGAPVFTCIQGVMCGKRLTLQTGTVHGIGRDRGKSIPYPDGTSGISRNQCSVFWDPQKGVFIRDDGSSYGTFVNGQQMKPGQWKPIKNKDIVTFGKEIYLISYGSRTK